MKTISIVSNQANLAQALTEALKPRFPKAKINVVEKISDVPVDSAMATFGMPIYVPTRAEGVEVIVVGTRNNGSAENRKEQYALIRNSETEVSDILAELGSPEEYLVLGNRTIAQAKVSFADHLLDISEATNEADKLRLTTEALHYVAGLIPGLMRKKPAPAPEEAPAA